jgi:hypothetical protein
MMANNEGCDEGPVNTATCNGNSAGPSVRCQPVKCGDGYVNEAAHEECDPGNGTDTNLCNGSSAGSVSCHFSVCGDGYLNSKTEECEIDSDCKDPVKKTYNSCKVNM